MSAGKSKDRKSRKEVKPLDPVMEELKKSKPEIEPLRQTPFHYPRNPSGRAT